MSATSQCHHPHVHINVNHHRSGDSNTQFLEITCRCTVCDVPMHFHGCEWGHSPWKPTMAPDGSEIRIPMRGAGEEPSGSQIEALIRMMG